MPHEPIRRATIHLPPDEHGTVTVRGIGFRWRCPRCRGSVRGATFASVRAMKREHEAACPK